MRASLALRMRRSPTLRHAIGQALYVGGDSTDPRDAFQPPSLLRALTRARSVTTRIFTAREHADRHCQRGNLGLATGFVAEWLTLGSK